MAWYRCGGGESIEKSLEKLTTQTVTGTTTYSGTISGSGWCRTGSGTIQFNFPNALVGITSVNIGGTSGISNINYDTQVVTYKGWSGSGNGQPVQISATITAIGH